MNNIQYTIRAVPVNVDKALRSRARKTGKSLNDTVIEALGKSTGLTTDATFNDLDWFIGSKSLDDTFDEAMIWLNNLPKDIA